MVKINFKFKFHLFTQTTFLLVHEVHLINIHLNRNQFIGKGTQYTCGRKKEKKYIKCMFNCAKEDRQTDIFSK